MAVYYWVGGHTGYTGMHSGYSTGTSWWTNWQTGTTSSAGDLLFAPYSWGITANWRIKLPNLGDGSVDYYDAPTELPQGGRDSVFFKKIFGVDLGCPNCVSLTAKPTAINPYLISCLYGGMSGDGFTASSSTGWAGNDSGLSAYMSIDITVDASWGPYGPSGGFDIGKIGKIVGITATPLRAYPGSTRLNESIAETVGATVVIQSMHSKTAVQNLAYLGDLRLTPYVYTIANGPAGPGWQDSTTGRMLKVHLKGGWGPIYHSAGSMVLGEMFSTYRSEYSDGFGITWSSQPANVLINGHIRKFVAEKTSNVHYYMVEPNSVIEGIEIKGRSMWPLSATHGPNPSLIRVSGWKNMSKPQYPVFGSVPSNGIILGSIPTDQVTNPVSRIPFYIDELHVDNRLSTFVGATHPAHVYLANTEINKMNGIAGSIVPLTNNPTNFTNKVRIKNGYIMNGFNVYTHDDYSLPNGSDTLVSMIVGITNTSGYSGAYSTLSNPGITTFSGDVYGLRYDNRWPSTHSEGFDYDKPYPNFLFPPYLPIGGKSYLKTFNVPITRPFQEPD